MHRAFDERKNITGNPVLSVGAQCSDDNGARREREVEKERERGGEKDREREREREEPVSAGVADCYFPCSRDPF